MKIVALGGGRPDANPAVDRFIVEFCGKERPRFLLLPTAGGDGGRYINSVKKIYKTLGYKADVLCLVRAKYEISELEERVGAADIIYAGGGNVPRMLGVWNESGLTPILKRAAENGAVMCGISAGAMCWFEKGYSDF